MNMTSIARTLAAAGVLIALSAPAATAASGKILKRGTAPVVKIKPAGKTGGGTARAQVDESDLTCNQGVMECAETLKTMCDLSHGGMSSQPGGADECAPPPD